MVYYYFHIMRSQRNLMLLKIKLLMQIERIKSAFADASLKLPGSVSGSVGGKRKSEFFLGSGCQLLSSNSRLVVKPKNIHK